MAPINPDSMGNVIELIKAGQYIQAIKLRREQTGEGLKEAKDYVDQLRLGNEMKVLKCKSIDEMRARISEMISINGSQRDFLLDVIDEAFYLGEDTGGQAGYMKALEENDHSEGDEDWEEEVYNNGWEEGREEGYRQGYNEGSEESGEEAYENGWGNGYNEGVKEGFSKGKVEGYENGHQTGLEQGRAERND